MARMQAQQAKVSELIKRTTGLSRDVLAGSFATVERANERAFRFRIGIGVAGLLLVLAFSLSASRSVLRALGNSFRAACRASLPAISATRSRAPGLTKSSASWRARPIKWRRTCNGSPSNAIATIG